MNRQLRDLWFTDGLDIQLAHDFWLEFGTSRESAFGLEP